MNTIAYASVFQSELDRQMVAETVTGWMDANASMAKYAGGREIKIPKITMDGLADYDRQTGYAQGKVTLEWETMQMTNDRARCFILDAMDVDETNFAMSAGNVMGEFQRTKVVPEVDAYRISKLNTLAGNRARSYTPAAASVFGALMEDIATVRDRIGDGDKLVVLISIPVASILAASSEIQKHISVGDFQKGEIFTRVKMLDDIPLLEAPSTRMKTAFTFYDGRTGSDNDEINPTPDQRPGGFAAASGAKDINWIVCARSAPIGVIKTDTIRIFDPYSHQNAHAWRIDYRKYHDLWVPENKLDGLYINRKA